MNYINLTRTFTEKMPVYPGDPEAELTQVATIENEGFTDHHIHSGMHVGTHMDAPFHMLKDGKYLSDISVEKFFGKGHLIDARGAEIICNELLNGRKIRRSDIVLVMTGWGEKYGEGEYYQAYPEISEAFAKKMVDYGVSIVGMDTPSPDRPPFAIHKILLKEEILIIENLTNLEKLIGIEEFDVVALPAKFHADAAPVRVVARIP